MGFLFGPAPIRRTLPYLQSCKLIFRNRVKIMEVHYNMYKKNKRPDNRHIPFPQHDSHFGLREFYFWNMPRVQFMNPALQIVRFTETSPNPFIRCWLEDGKDVIFDCDSQTKEQIMDRLVKTLGKTKEMMEMEKTLDIEQLSLDNDAIFGVNRKRFCICTVPGQCPCPSVVKLPKSLRGKFKFLLKDDLIKEEQEFVEEGKPLESPEPPFVAKIDAYKI